MMRPVRLSLVVAVSLITLLASGLASAQRGGGHGGGHQGGYHSGGGHGGGYYRGGEHHGGYYGGWGHHDQGNIDVVIGGSFWGWNPWWGYPSPYYYPYYSYYPYYPYGYYPYYPYSYGYGPSAVVPETPSYIEQEESGSSPSSSKWPEDWFYCPGSKAYYPYVKKCPGGWQTVPAKPPAGPER
jgi:hypothetical protein